MIYDPDEYAADDLEYETEARRNQFPQKSDARKKADVIPPAGDGVIPDDAYNDYEDIYENLAEYTMIPAPDQTDIANMSGS